MTKKKVVKTEKIKPTPEQDMNELVKVSQELFPEAYEPVSSDEPTETIEEESTESEVDVPENDNIAVIEAQEGTQDVPEATGTSDKLAPTQEEWNELAGFDPETDKLAAVVNELINLTPVGAEVVEDVVTKVDLEDPEDNYTESDEDGDGIPEHYVFDWANQPVAATLIHIRETKINSLVEKILFTSYLGGELYKNGVQLNRVPYRANVLIPTAKVEQFLSGEGKLEYEEGFPYTGLTVKGLSAHLFLKRIMAVSKKGAVITPFKKAVNNNGFLVSLQCKAPVAQSPSFQLAAHKPKYSVDELKELSAESLRIVCSWYNIPYKGKVQSRIDIKMKQDEL